MAKHTTRFPDTTQTGTPQSLKTKTRGLNEASAKFIEPDRPIAVIALADDKHDHMNAETSTQTEQKTRHPVSKSQKPHYHGHRDRLRKRLDEGGIGALAEYEVLELILFHVFPRKDVKPLAKDILKRFGTLNDALHASKAELMKVDGVGEAVVREFQLLKAVIAVTTKQTLQQQTILSTAEAVQNYCRQMLAHKQKEEFHILFLDKNNALIKDEKMSEGTLDHTPVYPREVIKRALELNATAMILIHNHPSGDPTPSQADILITREIVKIAAPLDLAVHDHVVVGRQGLASLRALRLM